MQRTPTITSERTNKAVVGRATKRLILYARKSQEREDRQVQSLDDQINHAQKLAKEQGYSIVHSIAEAHSAKTQGTRPGFKEMIEWVETGKADGVVCWHPDRLARNAVDGGWIMDLLDRGKLKHLLFTSGIRFDNTPEGKFMLNMVFSQAKYQVDKMVTDVLRGMVSKRERGGFPHRAPEGWMNHHIMATGEKTIVMDKERFPLLRQAIDLILSDTLVPAQALHVLNNEWGYTTRQTKGRTGGPLGKSSFYNLLCNPFIMGMCRHAGSLYQGKHPPLVTSDEFDRLQAITARSEKHRSDKSVLESAALPRFPRHECAFTGWLRCAQCGLGMITGSCVKGHIYYHCTNHQGKCTKRGVREEDILGEMNRYLDAIRLPDDLGGQLLTLVQRHLKEQGAIGEERHHNATANWEASLAQVEAQKQKLRGLLLRDVLSEADYLSENARLSGEEAVLRKKQAANPSGEENIERMLRDAEEVITFVQTAPFIFNTAYPAEKRHIARYLSGAMLPEGVHPRPRLDVNQTVQKVLLEPHPYLLPFVTYARAFRSVEPVKSGSGKQKRPTHGQSFLFGRTNETLNELAKNLCHQIEQRFSASETTIAGAPMHRKPGSDRAFPYTISQD